jgi:hypothetical protein
MKEKQGDVVIKHFSIDFIIFTACCSVYCIVYG